MNNKLQILHFFLICLLLNSADAQSWDHLGNGLDGPVRALYADTSTGDLYIGGNFGKADSNITVRGISMWDGSNYHPLGSGVEYATGTSIDPPPVTAITKYKNEILAGGYFGKAGGIKANGIAKWNGFAWDTLLNGVRDVNGNAGVVRDLLVLNGDLYVSGMFDSAGTIAAHNIAKWDGSNWISIDGFNYKGSTTFSLAYYHGKLYAAGLIEDSLNEPINIVSWDGVKWEPVGGGIKGQMSEVFCMKVYNNELYVGGDFTRAEGNVGEYIQKWNDSIWLDVGGGISDSGNYAPVWSMNTFSNELYVGGGFSHAGGILARNIAKWDGTNWCGLGSQVQPLINCFAILNNELYIGGGFWYIDSVLYNRIAKWTGGSYVDTCGNATTIEELNEISDESHIFPNPFSVSTALQFSKPLQNATLIIYDILGNEVKRIPYLNGKEINIARDGMQCGMYFYYLTDSRGFIGRGKMIVE
jgi:trimeric autotransporter adhesin